VASATTVQSIRRRIRLPRDAALGYALLIPTGIVLILLVGYPTVLAVLMSFQKKLLGAQIAPFIGLGNYESLLTMPVFWKSVRNVFIFTIASVTCKVIIGTTAAVILNETLPLRGVIRSIILLPWALPTLVTVLIWSWLYNDIAGVFNYVLMQTHAIDRPLIFLGDVSLAMPSVIAVNVWRGFPFFAITLLAGLQVVGEDLYDAAKVDGAGVVARFRAVTLPGLAPVLAVVTLLSTIWTFNDFVIIWMLTHGGPANETDVLSTITYRIAIQGLELGKGVAVSVLMLPILIGLVLLLTRFVSRREEGL
jgi:multiple sugar transport system permease protein